MDKDWIFVVLKARL